MNNTNNTTHIELDKNGHPLVSEFAEFASKHLLFSLKIFFYVVLITIGIFFVETFVKSPIIYYPAYAIGFVATLLSSIIAVLIPGLVFGNIIFPSNVGNLNSYTLFRISITFAFLFLPIARFLLRTIDRTFISFQARKIIFISASISIFICFFAILIYLSSTHYQKECLFSYTVLGIVYFLLISIKKEVRRPRIQQRPNPFDRNSSHFFDQTI